MAILSKRAQGLKPSPTLAITAKAKAMQAQGIKVIEAARLAKNWGMLYGPGDGDPIYASRFPFHLSQIKL